MQGITMREIQIAPGLGQHQKRYLFGQKCPIENLGDCLFFYCQNPSEEIIYISPSAEKMLGLPREKVCGKRWKELLQWSPECRPLVEIVFGGQLRGVNEKSVEILIRSNQQMLDMMKKLTTKA